MIPIQINVQISHTSLLNARPTVVHSRCKVNFRRACVVHNAFSTFDVCIGKWFECLHTIYKRWKSTSLSLSHPPTTILKKHVNLSNLKWALFIFFFFFFETEGQHANTRAKKADDHTASFMSSREEISPQSGIEPPTSSLGFGYLSTIIQ